MGYIGLGYRGYPCCVVQCPASGLFRGFGVYAPHRTVVVEGVNRVDCLMRFCDRIDEMIADSQGEKHEG